jgi:ABC-type uncharacterized transport system permease subunit
MLNAAHHRLPVDTHETQSLLGLLLALAFLLVYARFRTLSLGIFLLPLAFLMGLLPAFRPGIETGEFPGVHSGWLFLHIALLLAAYAALFVSLVASFLYLVQETRLKSKTIATTRIKLPPLETIDSIALRALLLGLPCMTAGLLIGSFLADISYGPRYFADPKILLAFAMWLAYIGMIYIRRHSGLRGKRAVFLSSFVFLVILCVWASNQFSAVHRFTAP